MAGSLIITKLYSFMRVFVPNCRSGTDSYFTEKAILNASHATDQNSSLFEK